MAIVTGGAGEVGTSIAEELLASGFSVALVDRDEERLEASELPGGPQADRVSLHVADVSDQSQVEGVVRGVVECWGRIDVLVNNAGVEPQHTIDGLELAVWDRTLDINLRGPMLMIRGCSPHLPAEGRIVNIGSRTWVSGTSSASYVSSKAGLVGLTHVTAVELGVRGITCNLIAPSFMRTQFHAQRIDTDVDTLAERLTRLSPLKRLPEVQDVAFAVSFLVSPRARNITGQTLYVAAGTQMPSGLGAQ